MLELFSNFYLENNMFESVFNLKKKIRIEKDLKSLFLENLDVEFSKTQLRKILPIQKNLFVEKFEDEIHKLSKDFEFRKDYDILVAKKERNKIVYKCVKKET